MAVTELNAQSTMAEVLGGYPRAQLALMQRYRIGEGAHAGFAPHDRLADVLRRHNVPSTEEVIEHIKACHKPEAELQITPRELAAALRSPHPPRLLDVRGPDERARARIAGALPASQELLQEMLASWSKDTPIVTHCHHGQRSLDAAAYLMGYGFTNVRSLQGGIEAWSAQVDPSVPRY